MSENLGTYLVFAAGAIGVLLGLYGLAPLIFRGRAQAFLGSVLNAQERKIVAEEMALAEAERERAKVFGLLVTSRRERLAREGFAVEAEAYVELGALAPSQEAAPAPESESESWTESLSAIEPTPDQPDAPAASVIAEAPLAEDEVKEVLELFREIRPVSSATRIRAAVIKEAPPVEIDDLLTEARWTARGLRPATAVRVRRRRG